MLHAEDLKKQTLSGRYKLCPAHSWQRIFDVIFQELEKVPLSANGYR
jgi:hypothetical protein